MARDACEERVRRAVNAICTCGGRGPHDLDACLACLVWHQYQGVDIYAGCVSQSGESETEGGE